MGNFTIYAVDRAGSPWEIETSSNVDYLFRVIAKERTEHPSRIYGIWDVDDPEAGDVEGKLEDARLLSMKLPVEAKDVRGFNTYPHRVGCVGGARKLHILAVGEPWRAMCGVVTDGDVDRLGTRPRPVCAACRKTREAIDDA